MFANLIIINL